MVSWYTYSAVSPMTAVTLTFASVLVISCISLIGALTISFSKTFLERSLFFLVSLAVGALFGDAIIHLIPEAFESFDSGAYAALFIIVGFFIFFILEKFLHWHHHHGGSHTHEVSSVHPLGRIVLVSDGMHNFLDGMIVAAAYLVSVEVGIATTIAIILHEVPQEIGDFGILIHAGYTRARALFVNFLSALAAILGAVVVFLFGEMSASVTPALVAMAAGSFLYIAGSDLVPELHKISGIKNSILQFAAIMIGVALMFALIFLE
ncbi:hypothetical protein A3D62_01640 [Candidatus Kaiserbacteria bacterium RIFCSPHIGHO2_02_FULL_49_11]|uniref:ZIP family metal transporter n=1 Tax=Candidatus Kaiserbacteria bacterium RIFCSPHIGHO2_02_FULL_49_11 TaxID=1798489 RepID=A0A1F6D1Q3_9BACT|nr:MAG: hypothetical protein A3D62_01640 [Candidatus Kaiserbacteria bacterium RIFCSPHIGHO2_02_FULL_49_11]